MDLTKLSKKSLRELKSQIEVALKEKGEEAYFPSGVVLWSEACELIQKVTKHNQFVGHFTIINNNVHFCLSVDNSRNWAFSNGKKLLNEEKKENE